MYFTSSKGGQQFTFNANREKQENESNFWRENFADVAVTSCP
jgi:hypothetical protein